MAVNSQLKIISNTALAEWRKKLKEQGRTLVVTNGCFDILHSGHITYLEEARNWGDALLVGLNGDESVRELKGPGRPINREADRAQVLAALEAVSAVCIFPEVRATEFLKVATPDIYVKGGDYTVDSIPREERRMVEGAGGKIVFLSLVKGQSTSQILQKITRKAPPEDREPKHS